ncbi:MAG: hypothetical protein SGJ18_14070 [Pseudomonadota bacterium]|nr:hypothetical protein [Pseudomonadota bacterium]
MFNHYDKQQIVSNNVCISCTGYKLDGATLTFANSKIRQLQDYCPSDAFIELGVKRAKSQYSIQLVVRASDSEISADCNGRSLPAALEESLSAVHARLREWRKERFQCPSKHGISQELKGGYN